MSSGHIVQGAHGVAIKIYAHSRQETKTPGRQSILTNVSAEQGWAQLRVHQSDAPSPRVVGGLPQGVPVSQEGQGHSGSKLHWSWGLRTPLLSLPPPGQLLVLRPCSAPCWDGLASAQGRRPGDQLSGWGHRGINPDTADSTPGQAQRPTVLFLSPPFLECSTGSEWLGREGQAHKPWPQLGRTSLKLPT